MKAHLLFLLLLVSGCQTKEATQLPEQEASTTDSTYDLEVARYSNSTTNPFNWGASKGTMKAWAKKVGWELSSQSNDSHFKPDITTLTYWVRKREGDHKQMLILQFRKNKMVGVNALVAGNMDKAYHHLIEYNCSLISPEVWECPTTHTVSQRQETEGYTSVIYSFADSRVQ